MKELKPPTRKYMNTVNKKNARLIHVTPVLRFYNPWNRHKTRDFVTFSVGMEMEHRYKMD